MTGAAFTKLKKLPPPVLSVVVVIVSCVAFNLVDYGYFVSVTVAKSVYSSRGILQAAAYLVSYVVAVTGIVVVLFSREAIARWAGLVLVTLFIALELCCRQVTGENIGFIHVNVALSQTEFIGEFLSSYRASVAKAIGLALVMAAVLYALVRLIKLRFHVGWIGVIPVSSVLIYAVLWKTVAFTDFYPSPLRIPVLAAYASLNSLYTGPRQAVELAPKAGVGPRVLILIVDESVRGGLPRHQWLDERHHAVSGIRRRPAGQLRHRQRGDEHVIRDEHHPSERSSRRSVSRSRARSPQGVEHLPVRAGGGVPDVLSRRSVLARQTFELHDGARLREHRCFLQRDHR